MRRLRALSIAAICVPAMLLALASAPSAVNASAAEPVFCHGVTHDYAKPLRRMVPVRRVPRSRQLPFGPRDLELRASGGVVVGHGVFGFQFGYRSFSPRPLHLNWIVSVRVFLVNYRGKVRRQVESGKRLLRVVEDPELVRFFFRTADRPAFYRLDIEIRSRAERRRLGRFSEYVRVVRPHRDVRLETDAAQYRQGEAAYSRLKNYGTSLFFFGPEYYVEFFNGTEWERTAFGPQSSEPVAMELGAGGAYECQSVRIPGDATPGRYRFVKRVFTGREAKKVLRLTAPFEVLPR